MFATQPNSFNEVPCRYRFLFSFHWEHFDEKRFLFVFSIFHSLGLISRSLLHRHYPSFNSKKAMKLKATAKPEMLQELN